MTVFDQKIEDLKRQSNKMLIFLTFVLLWKFTNIQDFDGRSLKIGIRMGSLWLKGINSDL